MLHNSEIHGSPPVADKATKQPSQANNVTSSAAIPHDLVTNSFTGASSHVNELSNALLHQEQILNNTSHIVVHDSFVLTDMVPKTVPIALDNTFGILNELEPASDGEALVEDLNHNADSTQILSDKELSLENSVRKLDCGNVLTWNNSFTMLDEDFPLLNVLTTNAYCSCLFF